MNKKFYNAFNDINEPHRITVGIKLSKTCVLFYVRRQTLDLCLDAISEEWQSLAVVCDEYFAMCYEVMFMEKY